MLKIDELSDGDLVDEYESLVKEMHNKHGLSGENSAYMERLIAELLYRLVTNEFDVQ